jgi:hypothetical protein
VICRNELSYVLIYAIVCAEYNNIFDAHIVSIILIDKDSGIMRKIADDNRSLSSLHLRHI